MSTDHEQCITNDFPGMFSRLIICISVLSTSQMERIYGMQFPLPDLRGNWSFGFLKLAHTEENHPTVQCRDCSKGILPGPPWREERPLQGCSSKRGRKFFSAARFPYTSKIPIKEHKVSPNCCP